MDLIRYNIRETLSQLSEGEKKIYLFSYAKNGFEMGFGKEGRYSGHSHLHYFDIMFAANGYHLYESEINSGAKPQLIVVPPRTFLPEIYISEFFFLKFIPSKGHFTIPDKVDLKLNDGTISTFDSITQLQFPWYKSAESERSEIALSFGSSELTVRLGDEKLVKIV